MKKILFIASVDMNNNSGGGKVNKALWHALNMYYPEMVDVLQPETKDCQNDLHFFSIPYLTGWQKFTHLLHGKIHRYNPYVLDFIDQHPNEYSHCIVNCGLFGDVVVSLKQRGLRVCTVHHNFEAKYQKDNKRPCTFGGLTDFFVKRNESKGYRTSDMNLFLTQEDADQSASVYGPTNAQNHVIGIFEVPCDSFGTPLTPLSPNRLVISGGLNSVQSVDGIKHFFEGYECALSKCFHDDYKVIIAGSNPSPQILKLGRKHPHVRLIPNPANMTSAIMESGIYLCPINKGSGIKTRILDGLKLGMPILAHKVSAQGYEDLWEKPWFQVYEDEKGFEDGLKKIVSIIQTQTNLREEIIREYQHLYSYESAKRKYVEIISYFTEMK